METVLLLAVAVTGEIGAEPEGVEDEFLVEVKYTVCVKETVVVESIVDVELVYVGSPDDGAVPVMGLPSVLPLPVPVGYGGAG